MKLCVSPTFSELHFPQPGDEKMIRSLMLQWISTSVILMEMEDAGGDLPTSS